MPAPASPDLPARLLLVVLQADADGEDAVVAAGRHVVAVGVCGQGDRTGERAITELRTVPALGLIRPLGVNGHEARADGDVDLLLGVEAGSSARTT